MFPPMDLSKKVKTINKSQKRQYDKLWQYTYYPIIFLIIPAIGAIIIPIKCIIIRALLSGGNAENASQWQLASCVLNRQNAIAKSISVFFTLCVCVRLFLTHVRKSMSTGVLTCSNTTGFMKTVPSVYTLLINTIYLF